MGVQGKRGNTDTLVDQILKGCKERGYSAEKLYLYNYEISPCIDCRNCKRKDHICILNDGMKQIYSKIEEADLIVFGTPNYWYSPSAKMRLLIDRIRPFGASKKLKGKKCVIVIPAAEGPEVCRPLISMFQMSFDYLGMKFVGKVLATACEKGEIKKNKKALEKAYRLGISLY